MTEKILCAIDGTYHADVAVEHAAKLAAAAGEELIICSVNILTGGLRGPTIYMHNEEEVEKILSDAETAARKHGAKKVEKLELRAREIGTAIVQYAEEHGVHHIVTGTGDKRGLSRLVLGSVAADIAGRAHCTVTVAR